MRKKLSTSIYTFRDIINENCMYVDKTKDIFKLILKPKGQYFFSRPRRFGKSLTISTLESIFLGEKELFKGLYIYEQDYDWKKYPVIKLSFSSVKVDKAEDYENYIIELNQYYSNLYKVGLKKALDEAVQKGYLKSY